MNEHLSPDPFESLEDEISSLNFGLQEDISIQKLEVEFYQFVSQICKEYDLEVALHKYPLYLGENMYTSFISLFSKAFVLNEDTHKKLYFANRLMYIYTMYMDDVFDEQEAIEVDVYFLISLLRDHAYVLLNDLFPKTSDFWSFAKKYQRRFIVATLQERKKWHIPTSYSLDEAFKIASGKASTAQMATTALACLSDSPNLIDPLEKSLDAFFSGVQFRDDLRDWRVDFIAGRYSYLLSQIIERKGLHNNLESITLEELARMIYFTGLAAEILNQAIDYYRQALSYIKNIPCTDWKIAIDSNISDASIILQNLKDSTEQEIDRVSKLKLKKESEKS